MLIPFLRIVIRGNKYTLRVIISGLTNKKTPPHPHLTSLRKLYLSPPEPLIRALMHLAAFSCRVLRQEKHVRAHARNSGLRKCIIKHRQVAQVTRQSPPTSFLEDPGGLLFKEKLKAFILLWILTRTRGYQINIDWEQSKSGVHR